MERKYIRSTDLREFQTRGFIRLLWSSGKTGEQAVHGIFYTYKWLQFAVADSAPAVLVVPRMAIEYTCRPIIDHLLYIEENPVINFSCGSLYITRFAHIHLHMHWLEVT